MKAPFRFALLLAVGGAVSLFSFDSEQAALPATDIGTARLAAGHPQIDAVHDAAAESALLQRPYEDVRTVNRGDTLMALLVEAGLPAVTADAAVRAMATVTKPRHIMPGQKITLTLRPEGDPNGAVDLVALRYAESVERDVAVEREGDGFAARAIERPLTRLEAGASGRIDSSLYIAGVEAGLPQPVLAQLIHVFSFDVDFQRDIREGDSFAVMYDAYRDETGREVKTDEILLAEMTLSGKTTRLYRFESPEGDVDYYDATGQSVRKALLRTPIDGARLSSGFGRRRHPVLGYTRMHRGLDFAASRGTPIYAAGDGVIEFAGRNSGYGNYVRIRHNTTYKTAYAHLNGFAKGVRSGRRVRQGEVIGYVGTTGLSTGPHLHYEVHKNGQQVNPRGIKLPAGRKLAGKELALFGQHRAALETRYAALQAEPPQVAEKPADGDEQEQSAAR